GEGVPDEFGEDGGTAGPGLDHALFIFLVQLPHFFQQVLIGKGAFFQAASHACDLPSGSFSPGEEGERNRYDLASNAPLSRTFGSRRKPKRRRSAASTSEGSSALAPPDDVFVRRLVLLPGLEAAGRCAPRGHRRFPPDGSLPFTTAVRVVHGVHHRTANRRTASEPARPSRFTDRDQFVIQVAHLTDGGPAFLANHADFAGCETDDGIVAFFPQQLRLGARRTHQLSAAARLQLDVV